MQQLQAILRCTRRLADAGKSGIGAKMQNALFLGIATFAVCWLLHVVVWRIRRPIAYPLWLTALFVLTPLAAGAALYATGIMYELTADPLVAIAGMGLHLALGACYTCGYAGIIEYSPSAEVLQLVQKHMPHGIEPRNIHVASLSEQALTGKRVAHLLASNMAESRDGRLMLTRSGRRVMAMRRGYRALFGIAPANEGLQK